MRAVFVFAVSRRALSATGEAKACL